jgi:hypothetical protein
LVKDSAEPIARRIAVIPASAFRGSVPAMRRILLLGTVVLLFAGRSSDALACSQCLCGSPTPPGYLLLDGVSRLNYSIEDRYLSKSNRLDDVPGDERQNEHRISGILTWHPAPRLALQGRLPYVIKTNVASPVGEAQTLTRSRGIGDGEVLARFDLARTGEPFTSRRAALAVVVAVIAPTGSNDARDGSGERVDQHLQPGSGAWSGLSGLAADLSRGRMAMSASVMFRGNGTNAHDYRYGNAVLFNLGAARTLGTAWQASLELNGRDAAQDQTETGERDPNSGGALIYAAPGIRWTGLGPVAIDLLVQIPVVQALDGDQTEKTTGRLALIWTPR